MAVPTESERKQSGTRLTANCFAEIPTPLEGFWPSYRFVGAGHLNFPAGTGTSGVHLFFSLRHPHYSSKAK
ncbi:hypothetical protein LOK74_21410 [Brevibacillus humidisoli]|uniref:hypothetical protein n=1 Tax=Brevibacillus humidisoli TaxID=2895522 RepID=UPI001E641B89|nr:hypothetical protein [Brevibacillus humidisoli]UFJ40548.1 hypothetical protein LOK74_21410 [Brevibacillus humidisoli]